MNRLVRSGRRTGVAVAVCASLAVVGCGITAEPDAKRIPPEQVPFDLMVAGTTTIPETGSPVSVFLLSDDRLLAVDRTLPSNGSLADLLALAVAGPTEQERVLGITSAIPTDAVDSITTSRGVAEVDLNAEFGELRSSDQVFALAQIVYVLTGRPGIGAVAFTLEGEPISAPGTDGTVDAEPLTRDDFAALAPT